MTRPHIDYSNHYFVDNNGCWIWKGRLDQKGYGHMNIGRKTIGAHRYLYELHIGKIPEGMQLDHLCRVRNCVNPNHLEIVTNKENSWRGNRCKINFETAEKIREAHKNGANFRGLQMRFNIDRHTIADILSYKIWNKQGGN